MTTPPDALDLEELERLLQGLPRELWIHLSGHAIPDEIIAIRHPEFPPDSERYIHIARTTSVSRPGLAYFVRRTKAKHAALITAAVNALPALVRIARAAQKEVSIISPRLRAELRAAGLLKETEDE